MQREPIDEDDLERGRRLFARPCAFVLGAVGMAQLPPADLPEVALAGRSNVGKSSLLNALTRRKALARTSNTPGRTQELNFFDLDGRLRLADLPGYGYAAAPKAKVDRWTRLTLDYLRGRPNLRRVLLLVDARHGAKANDVEIMTLLDQSAVAFQVVLTKADKITPPALEALVARTEAALAAHVAGHPDVAATSARDGDGIDVLRAILARLAMP